MVMDATQPQQPSPQSVGREFVRQYYTLLNKAPNHLHRFYNNNSSFIHGESTLVVGQKNIHNRIQQLNFHDCHAKISQVDAQATLGNGVVVQVTGELSNDGQPMRRFTQTFVLAAQSPKKYYVHNDIFRYQDLYSDEEADVESRSENDDEHEQQPQQVPPQPQGGQGVVAPVVQQANEQHIPPVVGAVNEQQPLPSQVVTAGAANAATAVLTQQAQAVYYPMPAATGGRPMAVLPPPPGATPVAMTANFANAASGVPQQAVPTAAGVTQLNGVVAHDELMSNMQQSTVSQQPPQLTNQTPSPVLAQAAGAVPVGNPTVLGAQPPASGISGVAVATSASAPTGLQQNAAPPAIPNYQQSPLVQTHILQQQPQMQQQQPLPNTPSQQLQQQQTIIQQQQSQTPLTSVASNMIDVDDSMSSNTISISSTNAPPSQLTEQQQQSRPNTAANVVVSGQTIAPTSANTVLEHSPVPVVEDFKTINEQQQQEKYEAAKQQQHQQHEPKTYANLFKSSSPSSFVNAAMQQQQQIQQQQQQQTASSMYHQTNSSNISSSNTYSQSTGASTTSSIPVYGNRNSDSSSSMRQQQDNNNSQGSGVPLPQRSNAKGFNKDFDQRRTSNVQQFGDNQQLFLGNIPHHASEEELKVLFSRFGQVVDLRILSKSSGKIPPGGRNPLNYGFITYNDPEAVQNCLANCPLYFPDGPEGQKLNVEEKKPRARNNDMPPRQSMGGGGGVASGMNSNMNNNQRNMSGGPPSRSLSNSGSGGSMMRGNSVGNNSNSMSRGGSSGGGSGVVPPRMGGAFNRNDNRASNGSGGSQMRGGNNNSQSQGNSYGVRR